jgi:hypothetical protein
MTRRFRKPWSNNAFTQGKKRKGKVCPRRLVSFLLVSPTDLVGNKKGPFLAVPGEWNTQFLAHQLFFHFVLPQAAQNEN